MSNNLDENSWMLGGYDLMTGIKRLYLRSKNEYNYGNYVDAFTEVNLTPTELYYFVSSPEMRRYICETVPKTIQGIEEDNQKRKKAELQEINESRKFLEDKRKSFYSDTREDAKVKLNNLTVPELKKLGLELYPKSFKGTRKAEMINSLLNLFEISKIND